MFTRVRRWSRGWLTAARSQLILAYLAVQSCGFIAIGLGWTLYPTRARELGVDWLPVVSSTELGVAWIVAGVLGLASFAGLSRRVAFYALQVVPLTIGAYFLVSWGLVLAPGLPVIGPVVSGLDAWPEGAPRGWIATVTYWTFWAGTACIFLLWQDEQQQARRDAKVCEGRIAELVAQLEGDTRSGADGDELDGREGGPR